MVRLLYEEETYRLRKMIFQVRNELGAGWNEHIYHQALKRSLEAADIPVVSKPRGRLRYRGEEIHVFEPDLVVWNKIILELKVLPDAKGFANEHVAQLIHYLKFFDKRLGMLVDFAPDKVRIKRVIWHPNPFQLTTKNFDPVDDLTPSLRKTALAIRQAVETVGRTVGLGYSDSIYRRLMEVELREQGLSLQTDVEAPAIWRNTVIAYQRTPFLVVEDQILFHVITYAHGPVSYELARCREGLRNLHLPLAILANFGYRQLQLFTLSPD